MSLEAILKPIFEKLCSTCPINDLKEGKEPDFGPMLSYYAENALEIDVDEKKVYHGHEELKALFTGWFSCGQDWTYEKMNESFTGSEDLIRYSFEMKMTHEGKTMVHVDKVQFWRKSGDKHVVECSYYTNRKD